jgi:hypothetical protein
MASTYSDGKFFYFCPQFAWIGSGFTRFDCLTFLQRENVSCFLPGVLPLVLMSQAFNL